jgi:hypothetical protein
MGHRFLKKQGLLFSTPIQFHVSVNEEMEHRYLEVAANLQSFPDESGAFVPGNGSTPSS